MPAGNGLVVVMLTAESMVTEKLAVAVFPRESLAWTVKVAEPAIGVAPESTPALERLNPTAVRLVEPVVTVQV